jgi:hypothetical protein
LEVDKNQKPVKAGEVFSVDQDFRFDVMVTGKNCPFIKASVEIRIGAHSIRDFSERRPLPITVGLIEEENEKSN